MVKVVLEVKLALQDHLEEEVNLVHQVQQVHPGQLELQVTEETEVNLDYKDHLAYEGKWENQARMVRNH